MNSRRSIAFPAVVIFFKVYHKTLDRKQNECAVAAQKEVARAAEGWAEHPSQLLGCSLRLGGFHPLGRIQCCQNDALIAGTAAKITGNRDSDLTLGGLRVIA